MSSAHSILPLLSTILLLCSAATTVVSGPSIPVPVLDTDGHPVLSLTPYYITGALESNGNGLHLIRLNDTCRNNVKLATPKLGEPSVFFPYSGNEIINVNENLRISSGSGPLILICDALWWLNAKTGLVTVGAIFTEEHSRTFRIVRHEILGADYYKILFCPVDGFRCVTLGLNDQLLGRSTTPLIVQFKKVAKVSEVSAAMHSTA